MRIPDSRILVTGASSGIGAALAHRLAHGGARLILSGRHEVRLRHVAMDIVRRNPRANCPIIVPCDLADSFQAHRLVDRAAARWGGLDALVNNAGISAYGHSRGLPLNDFRRIMEVNFFGPVRTTVEALSHFQERGRGTVVNVASLAALYGVPFLGAYGASKAALVNFSQSLRAEVHGSGVRILVVYPNYTDTDLFANETKTGTAHRPAGRYQSPEDVATAIVHAMEQGQEELVLTFTGKAMQRVRGLAPSLLDRVMGTMAARLENEPSPESRRRAS